MGDGAVTPVARVMIVDDEPHIRRVLEAVLQREGLQTITAETPERALALAAQGPVDLLISDLIMPELTGVELMQQMRRLHPDLVTILVTAHGTVRSAVDAMKLGAFDFVPKPFEIDRIRTVVRKAIGQRDCGDDGRRPRRERTDAEEAQALEDVVGDSPRMHEVYRVVRRVADSRATVLLRGESGTGKELIARALHQYSSRNRHPFVSVSAAALSEDLLESELFGHEKGAFTGSVGQRIGRFELADGGTLFLDEIGDISPKVQIKLLRVLQEREFERVGGTKSVKVDVRLVGATNRDLESAVATGHFRHDLYYRLQVIQITMPPLRQRKEDLGPLLDHFLTRFARDNRRAVKGISDAAMAILARHSWPGNVRELENCVEYAVVMSDPDAALITPDVLPLGVRTMAAAGGSIAVPSGTTFEEAMAVVERELLLEALKKADWDLRAAAGILGLNDRSVEHYVSKHGLHSRADWLPALPVAAGV